MHRRYPPIQSAKCHVRVLSPQFPYYSRIAEILVVCCLFKFISCLMDKDKNNKRVVRSQGRQMVQNVYNFISVGPHAPATVSARVEATAKATGVSARTVYRIIKEHVPGKKFVSPRKSINKPKARSTVDECDEEIIRRTIYNFACTQKCTPTMDSVFQAVKDAGVTFKGQIRSFRRLISCMGFQWKKTRDNQQILLEKHEIRAQRSNFLRKIRRYRAAGWNIVYSDETSIHSSHIPPYDKGQRLIIAHAGGASGFVEGSLLIYRSGTRSGKFHGDMNLDNYVKWLKERLIPNLPPRSVFVIDNESYHNVPVQRNPTSNWSKKEMQQWVQMREIAYEENFTRPELFQHICLHKPTDKRFVVDDLLRQNGHCVLRLPALHPDLNPIERIWIQVKNHVAIHNETFKLDDVWNLVEQKLGSIDVSDWRYVCDQVIEIENEYLQRERIIDEIEESIIDIGNGDSDFSDLASDSEEDDIKMEEDLD